MRPATSTRIDGGASLRDRGLIWVTARAVRAGAVLHELHVAGAARLVARGRDLVGDVTCRDQPFRERHAVLGKEHYLQPALRRRVTVDRFREVVDELDDYLREPVGW